jgi:HSP20 family molecular chaperone IbpA
MNPQTTNTIENTANRPERLSQRPAYLAPVDVLENREEYLILADFPGVKNDDVDIRFDKNELSLSGRVPGSKLAREFDWTRTFVVPGGVDPEKISAELKDGVLTVKLPKKESVKPRQIAVRAG